MSIMPKMQHQLLCEYVHFTDPGIECRAIQMEWGTLVTLYRQGYSTRWRVRLYNDGSARITHPKTATLPAVDLVGPWVAAHEQMVVFIQQGWV